MNDRESNKYIDENKTQQYQCNQCKLWFQDYVGKDEEKIKCIYCDEGCY